MSLLLIMFVAIVRLCFREVMLTYYNKMSVDTGEVQGEQKSDLGFFCTKI